MNRQQPAPITAQIALLPAQNSCLANLPHALCSALDSAHTLIQNVVVEITFRDEGRLPSSSAASTPPTRSIFVGWTGNVSQTRPAPVLGRDGISRSMHTGRDVNVVEIDQAFARLVGIKEGQRIAVTVHTNPPLADVINIEPITSADWEMIELHAQFLEINFLSQVRALPNPSFEPPDKNKGIPRPLPHPVVLHLSPTSTANVRVTSLSPALGPSVPFAKISPNAEVIVAPKTRSKPQERARDTRSVTSLGRRSIKSTASVKTRSRDDFPLRGPVFLRGLDSSVLPLDLTATDTEGELTSYALQIWVDPEVLQSRQLKGVSWVVVSLAMPTNLLEPVDPQQEAEAESPSTKVVAKVIPWLYSPSPAHCALSPFLSKVLAAEGAVGELFRIEAAPSSIPKPSALKGARDGAVKSLKIYPFATASSSSASAGFKFGGDTRQEKEELSEWLKVLFGKGTTTASIFDGPISDGMILPSVPSVSGKRGWPGGIIRFDAQASSADPSKPTVSWFLGTDRKFSLDVQPEVGVSSRKRQLYSPGERLPRLPPQLVAVDEVLESVYEHLLYSSSVLLPGGMGSGKTEVARSLALRLQREHFFYVVYISCKKMVSDEARISTLKDTLERAFGFAAWGTRVDGRALVVLDDLDKIAPAETELQVGNENGRSRHVSEILCSLTKKHCGSRGSVTLLATARSKEALNSVLVGGHIVQEIVPLKAPNKDGRRKILEVLAHQDTLGGNETGAESSPASKSGLVAHNDVNCVVSPAKAKRSQIGRTNGVPPLSSSHSGPNDLDKPHCSSTRFFVDRSVDLLEIAGQTDGYMPGDLVLLVSRARNEAMIRIVSEDTFGSAILSLTLTMADFASALKGFTPASLRNVTLQKSDVKWDTIGGLTETKQILLETIQYPTTYAPIFAACPLRLRSGLLLYGYPGCGKTLLASAVASESGLNFISVKGPEILNKYIGASEKGVRDLFERAEAARPCVLFFDEFDSIAPKRGHDSTGVTDRVVNQLLTLMDGAEGLSGVYVLAATSRPDLIDSALLRPGRLDKSLLCDMPNEDDRLDILRALSTKIQFGDDVWASGQDLRDSRLVEIARRTEGYSGADLRAVVQNAQLEAIHEFLNQDEAKEVDKSGGSGKGQGSSLAPTSSAYPEFSYFEFGKAPNNANLLTEGEAGANSQLAEKAVIAAKLSQIKTRNERRLLLQQERRRTLFDGPSLPFSLGRHHGRTVSGASFAMTNGDMDELGGRSQTQAGLRSDDQTGQQSQQPRVFWRHFESALGSSRPSISAPERARFDSIYAEFVAGRNGELPNGQGGSEIGGRTTLM